MINDANVNKRFAFHLTHNDMDALGCALIVKYYYKKKDEEDTKITGIKTKTNVENVFCAIGYQDNEMLDFLNKLMESPFSYAKSSIDFIISDISIKEDTINELKNCCEKLEDKYGIMTSIKGYDHHISNKSHLVDKDFITVDRMIDIDINEVVPVSATKLMHNMLCVDEPLFDNDNLNKEFTFLCDSISRYDTWVWKNKNLMDKLEPFIKDIFMELYEYTDTYILYPDDFYTVISKKIGISCLYDKFCNRINNIIKSGDTNSRFLFDDTEIIIYEIEKDHEEVIVDNAVKHARIGINGEYIVGYYLPNEYSNAVTEALYEEYPFVDYWMILVPSVRKIEFRSNKDDVNVSRIAKRTYGGGGHKSASGAKNIDTNKFMFIMDTFYKRTVKGTEIIEELVDSYKDDEDRKEKINSLIDKADFIYESIINKIKSGNGDVSE